MQTVKTAKIRQLKNGAIEALSSNGQTVYHLTIGERNSCDCPAGNRGARCYHWTTAANRIPAFWPAPWARRQERN